MLQGLITWKSESHVIFYFKHAVDKVYFYTAKIIKEPDRIINIINEINCLSTDKQKIKKFYKDYLIEGRISNRGGGGIGLIDLVRKSQNKLLYKINDFDPPYKWLSLIVTVDIE